MLIISGLPVEERFAKSYASAGSAIATVAQTKYGVPAANVIWLADTKELHTRVNDRSTKENVERELRAIAARAGAQDRVLIVLYGHGSFMAGVLAGPVYRLLGAKDLGTPGDYLTDPMPPVEQLVGGELAWRQHNGGHDVTPNWPTFSGRFRDRCTTTPVSWARSSSPPPSTPARPRARS